MRAAVVLLSGGKGVRMGGALPKQYLKLCGKEAALYSFDLFQKMEEVGEIVVVAEKEFHPLFKAPSKRLIFAKPGERRQDSLQNGIKALSKEIDLVLVHDAARPLISHKDARRVLEEGARTGAAVLGVPVNATLKRVCNGAVLETVDRSSLFEAQTPQVLRKELLERGLQLASEKGLTVTDDVSLAELLGVPVQAVLGSAYNLKLTTPEDVKIAEAAIECFID